MSKQSLIKTGAVVLLIAAALLTPPPARGWLVYGLMFFGIANVLAEVPGTTTIRLIAAVATFGVLILKDESTERLTVLLAWLIWLPAFMVGWALARRSRETAAADSQVGNEAAKRARAALAAVIAAAAVGAIVFRVIVFGGLQQTAALFVGIPALLAIVVVMAVSPRSATGVACKAVTVGLLVSLLFLGEGMLCIAISAPLFYVVAIVIAQVLQRLQLRRDRQATLLSSLVLFAILPMSLEGVLPATTIGRDETVVQTKIVHASAEKIAQALFQSPRFDRQTPRFLRAGFPRPILTEIENTPDETRWLIRFRGGEMRITGIEPRTGDLILVLDEMRPGYLRWRAVSDSSHTTHFLYWRETIVEWSPVDAENSRVTWTIRYDRALDPAWGIGPLERYAVRLAADYLIDSVATP